jgi:hypothetical protein
MSRLLREIIAQSLSPHEDLEVSLVELADRPEAHSVDRIDVLILGSNDAELSSEHELLLRSRPWLRILAIDREGRQAALYELRTHRTALTQVSPEGLADAVRTACAEPGAFEPLETSPRH